VIVDRFELALSYIRVSEEATVEACGHAFSSSSSGLIAVGALGQQETLE